VSIRFENKSSAHRTKSTNKEIMIIQYLQRYCKCKKFNSTKFSLVHCR